MTPAFCRVKQDAENGSFGDCVRACVASIIEMDSEKVPHFFHDNCDGHTGNIRIAEFLRPLGLAPFLVNYDGSISRQELMDMMHVLNRDTYYLLFGRTNSGDHVVVCRGGTQAHDPAWLASPLVGPGSHGHWSVMVIARS